LVKWSFYPRYCSFSIFSLLISYKRTLLAVFNYYNSSCKLFLEGLLLSLDWKIFFVVLCGVISIDLCIPKFLSYPCTIAIVGLFEISSSFSCCYKVCTDWSVKVANSNFSSWNNWSFTFFTLDFLVI